MKQLSTIKVLLAVAVAAAPLATGCASTPIKSDASISGIRAAEEVGAEDVPRAALHLQLAKEQLARAEQLASEGDTDEADSMLLRAEADAELAVLLSREKAEKAEAAVAAEQVRALRLKNQ